MYLNLKPKQTIRAKGSTIAALDIGTSKICCFIARITDTGGIHVIGIGHHESRGLKSGKFIDMEAAEIAIGQAIQSAEDMAGETISSVVVNLPNVHTLSHQVHSQTYVSGGEVTDNDVRRALTKAREVEVSGQNELIHAIPVQYTVEKNKGVKDPKGMHGKHMTAQIHAITGASNAVKNFRLSVSNNHLEVEAFCVDAYAAALSCLVEDERDLGCTVIDMGAGTTSIAVFMDGTCVYTDAIPIGGGHVTHDIARGLTTPINHAERIKTLYGNAIQSTRDNSDMIEVPQIGEDENAGGHFVPRSILTSIIQPRLEETFEMIRARLEASGYSDIVGRRVVLTGGACQLSGLRELGTLILDKQIRIAHPIKITGLANATSGPAFSSACGMLAYAAHHLDEVPDLSIPIVTPGTMVTRIGQWLKENW